MESKWKNVGISDLIAELEGREMEGYDFVIGGSDEKPVIRIIKG
jgi:hypothetical protein